VYYCCLNSGDWAWLGSGREIPCLNDMLLFLELSGMAALNSGNLSACQQQPDLFQTRIALVRLLGGQNISASFLCLR